MTFFKKFQYQLSRILKTNKILILIIIILGFILGFILILALSTKRSPLLPSPKQASVIYDVNQKEYTRLFVENRLDISLQKMPELLRKAIINVEDNRFYEHSGIDFKSIGRAIWVDIRGGGYIEGGSTITQQLARNVLLTQKKRLPVKFKRYFWLLVLNVIIPKMKYWSFI